MITTRQQHIIEKSDNLHASLVGRLSEDKHLAIIEAPPGSGKTYMLLRLLSSFSELGWRIAVAAQTNKQADDITRQLALFKEYGGAQVTRFISNSYVPSIDFPDSVRIVEKTSELPVGPQVIVSTSAKWALVSNFEAFDLLAVDEAWQMNWATLMRCADLAPKYLLIGDPGQIPPVTTVDVSRWGTSDRAPHKAAPVVALEDPQFEPVRIHGMLPSCRRLPAEAVPYVKMFYDFDFEPFAEAGDRAFHAPQGLEPAIAGVFNKLSDLEPVMVTIPTPVDGPPTAVDVELARTIRDLVAQLTKSGVELRDRAGGELRQVRAADIGISSTHRAMNGAIRKALGAEHSGAVVDTPERWQGLEKPIMIAVHPLSGVTEPSEFDLETGRLCVMASRQTAAMIFVARDHVGPTISNTIPAATQAPGQPDRTGRGRRAHLEFWEMLEANDRIVPIG